MANGSYIRVSSYDNYEIYKFDFTRNANAILRVIGEGNSNVADDYSITCSHNGGKVLVVTHNSGPLRIKIYRDHDFNYYVYISSYGHAILYFDNRVPINNIISATSVDRGILETLIQEGV